MIELLKGALSLSSVPLWFGIGLAITAYCALFLPPFGSVNLDLVRREWGWAVWLVAVGMTTISVAQILNLAANSVIDFVKRRRRRERNLLLRRYARLYAPMLDTLHDVHMTMGTGQGSPFFRQRLRNAHELLSFGGARAHRRVVNAWRALSDRQQLPTTGEVEFGGAFPIDRISALARKYRDLADDRLLTLVRQAERSRIEDQRHPSDLSEEDCALVEHVSRQYDQLRQLFRKG